jgi:hypothetical protein
MFVPMTRKLLLGIIVATAFGLSTLVIPFEAVEAVGNYLGIKDADISVKNNKLRSAEIETFGKIPKSGAFGYGVLTSNHPTSVIVATTHGGVLDSELQKGNIDSPIWHNHYVRLATGEALCDNDGTNPDGLYVADISYESPGNVDVDGKEIEISKVPFGNGISTHFGLAPNAMTSFDVGEPENTVVSFTLRPAGSSILGPAVVCVDSVTAFTIP